jgi:accessory gene regulator B
MLKKISYNIAYFFVCKNIIDVDNIEIYQYGFEQIISTIYTIITILAIALLTNSFISSALFLVVFVALRRFTGGYHANSYLTCYLGFVSIYISFILILRSNILEKYMLISFILLIVSVLIIAVFSPVEHENKPINNKKKIKYKKLSLLTLIIELLVLLLFFSLNIKFFSVIMLNIILVAILQIIAVIYKRYFNISK